MKVETYNLKLNGRHIRQATKVVFDDGVVVPFTEKMPKRMAITQATAQRKAHPEYFQCTR